MTNVLNHEREHPELTPDQEESLRVFRKELLEEGVITEEGDTLGTQHDHVLLRFLRARKFNVKASKLMIANCLEWRATVQGVGIDEVYRKLDPYEYPERKEVFKYWPLWYHKTDKKGRPINVQSLGGIDTTALYQAITPEKFWEVMISISEALVREALPSCSYQEGRLIDSVLVIIDLKDFGLGKFWQMKNLVRDMFQVSQDYFPETMGMLVVVNAPYSFAAIWAAVRPWLAKETQDKVHIFGTDYKPFLLEHIDAANLPATLGGECTCADVEGGCAFGNRGPWMEGRKERREKWLRGEIARPGLGLEDREKEEVARKAAVNSPAPPVHSSSPPSAAEL